ncbi:hypothetical protein IJM16_00295 [Candidatus Saccharibacteria bacterium]|nr:hypothetical protein [Candidatus Saccharibacteria bacterium]
MPASKEPGKELKNMERFAKIFMVVFWSFAAILYGILFIAGLPFEVLAKSFDDEGYRD